MAQDREEARDTALGEYTRRGYEPPSDRSCRREETPSPSPPRRPTTRTTRPGDSEAAGAPSQSWLQLICRRALGAWRQVVRIRLTRRRTQ